MIIADNVKDILQFAKGEKCNEIFSLYSHSIGKAGESVRRWLCAVCIEDTRPNENNKTERKKTNMVPFRCGCVMHTEILFCYFAYSAKGFSDSPPSSAAGHTVSNNKTNNITAIAKQTAQPTDKSDV